MIPIPHLGQAAAHPNEAMISIQLLLLTGHANESRGGTAIQPA